MLPLLPQLLNCRHAGRDHPSECSLPTLARATIFEAINRRYRVLSQRLAGLAERLFDLRYGPAVKGIRKQRSFIWLALGDESFTGIVVSFTEPFTEKIDKKPDLARLAGLSSRGALRSWRYVVSDVRKLVDEIERLQRQPEMLPLR